MIEHVNIPADRIPALKGRNFSTMKRIEEETGTVITIDDSVRIEGKDPLMLLKTKEIVTAIGRGFDLRTSLRLLEDECELHVLSLQDETQKKRRRLLARVIGRKGRAKEKIEGETGAAISVKGKTVSVIGTPGEMKPAEDAVRELLSGKTHGYAYGVLSRAREKS